MCLDLPMLFRVPKWQPNTFLRQQAQHHHTEETLSKNLNPTTLGNIAYLATHAPTPYRESYLLMYGTIVRIAKDGRPYKFLSKLWL